MDWKQMNDTDISYNRNSWQIDVVSFSCECWHQVLVSLTQFYTDFGPHEFKEIDGASHSNETLVCQGFLSASPEKPSLAFSIELLEIYQQLRRVCPWFSLDALARALCHIHQVRISPFDRYWYSFCDISARIFPIWLISSAQHTMPSLKSSGM